jgi:hypothetical protein
MRRNTLTSFSFCHYAYATMSPRSVPDLQRVVAIRGVIVRFGVRSNDLTREFAHRSAPSRHWLPHRQ